MSNPFRSARYLPWTDLFLAAGLTVLIATAIDILLRGALTKVAVLTDLLLKIPIVFQLLSLAAPFGVGALAIFVTLQFFHRITLRSNTIWALVGCLLLILLVKGWLVFIPALFLQGFGLVTVIAVTLGSFTASRRYWR